MIWTVLIILFVLVIASTWWFGLWSNFITLVNLILAALIATSFYQNVTALLLKAMETYAVLIEFVAIWMTFVAAFVILRGATDVLSSIRLRFDNLTELIGRTILSVSIAFVFICFATFTLQLAPLPPHLFEQEKPSFSFGDAPETAEEIQARFEAQTKAMREMADNKYEEAIGPDKLWDSTVRLLSSNSLSTPRTEGLFYGADTREYTIGNEKFDFLDNRLFDPMESFFVEAAFKRSAISRQEVLRIETAKKR